MTISELVLCVVTVDPLSFVPLAFFAAALTFIGEKRCPGPVATSGLACWGGVVHAGLSGAPPTLSRANIPPGMLGFDPCKGFDVLDSPVTCS